jgi:hypothetical protein
MKSFAAATALLLALAAPAHADLVTLGGQSWDTSGAANLTLSNAVPSGNQVQNLPCIICGANQPQQPTGFGYNLFGNTGNESTVSFFSTATVGGSLPLDTVGTGYTVGDGTLLNAILNGGGSFSVGLDVNDTNQAQTLESFWFLNLTTHSVLAVYSPGPGGTLIPDINNGTGFPDYTINGLTLDGISAGDQVVFFARITGANDGPDSFFLIPQAVPGPALGAGIPGLIAGALGLWGFARRRRRMAAECAA